MLADPLVALRAGLVGGASLALMDLAVSAQRMPDNALALGRRFAVQLGGITLLGGAVALGLWLIAWVLRRAGRSERTTLGAALGAASGGLWGLALFSGTGVRRLGLQLPLVAAATMLAALAVARAAWRGTAPRVLHVRPALTLIALALYAAHASVLVRQYPLLHLLVALSALGFASLSALRPGPAGRRWLLALPVCALVVLSLGRAQRVRSALRASAPLGQYAVRLAPAARISTASTLAAPRVGAQRFGPHLPLGGRDIVLVTVDALRADMLRANGGRGRMPNADAMARAGVNFRNAYCSTPHTSYSLASLMIGAHARAALALHGSEGRRTLAQHLAALGYAGAGFYPPAVFAVDRARFGSLADTRFGFAHAEERYADADELVRRALTWLRARPNGERVFLWLHFFEPHERYEVHPGLDFGADARSRYESECAQVDRALGELRRAVAALGREPAWVLTADHGEEFGEHGGSFHGSTVYSEQVRVPLVWVVPGLGPRVVDSPVSLVDVAPTILGGVGMPRPARMTGDDLGPLVYRLRWERPVFAETASLRRVILGREALITDLDDGTLELFDLDRDPLERTNLVDARAERAAALRAEVTRWEEANARADLSESEALPAPLLRAMQGERSAAMEVARLAADVAQSERVRRRALAVLGDLDVRDPALRALLLPIARGDGGIATDAGLCLALLADPAGAEGAARVLREADRTRRRLAALGLARLGDARGASLLGEVATDPNAPDTSRDAAVYALAELRHPGSFEVWRALLRDPRLAPRAAEALGAQGDPRAAALLRDALPGMAYPLTRRAALGALVALSAPGVAGLLRDELGRGDPLPDVFPLLRALQEPGEEIVGRRRVSAISAGRSRALKLGRDEGPWSPLRRVYLRVRASRDGEVRVAGVRVLVTAGSSQIVVDLPSPLRGHRVRVTPDVDLRVLSIAAR